MRRPIALIVAVSIAALALPPQSSAQWRQGPQRGLFGDRELGRPLKPRESRFRSGLERGPSGTFEGTTTANRGTTFRSRTPPQPAQAPLVPPEAYDLEPDMVPAYLEAQARRMAQEQQRALQQQSLEQQRALARQRAIQQQRAQQQQTQAWPEPQQPLPQQPVMPTRPQRYLPPAMPSQPGFPQPQPGVPGPAQEELQNSPDRWFRGAPSPSQPEPSSGSRPSNLTQPRLSAPTLGPSGIRGSTGVNRPNTAALGARITQALGNGALGQISATLQGDAVTLQGTVATATDRHLAERMAAMEPGVRQINNRITVQGPAPAP